MSRSARRVARVRTAGALTALLIAVLAGLLLPPRSASADPTDSVPDFLGCLRGHKVGSLLFLFDTTGSLVANDPHKRRADAAKALVAELSAFAEANEVQLDAAIAGFGANYQRAGDWNEIGSATGVAAMNSKIDAVSAITSGTFESDFWTALQGARADLQAQNAQSSKPGAAAPCQALLWFTDGEFHLNVRTNQAQLDKYGETKPFAPNLSLADPKNIPAATRRGVDNICANGGPADQLRADNVTIWSVGLSPSEQSNKPDLSLLQRVAEGTDGAGKPCGRLRTPPGRYFQVDDVNRLVQDIWAITHPGAQHLQRFVLDDALSGVSIAAHQSGGHGLRIVGPGAIGTIVIPPQAQGAGATKLASGVTATWRWLASDSVTVDLARGTSPTWLGIWSIRTADGRAADPDDLQVSFRGDILPAWAEANTLVAGRVNQVRLGLVRPDGTPVLPLQVPGTVKVSGEFVPPTGESEEFTQDLGKTMLADPHPLDLTDVSAGQASVRLTLDYITQSVAGLTTTLAPQVVIVPVQVSAPPDRGTVQGSFAFGDVTGPADVDAVVTVTGPSCVWLPAADPSYVGPPEIQAATVTSPHNSPETCLKVDAGARADFPAHLTTTYGGSGGLTGTVVLNLAPENNAARFTPVTVDIGAQLSNPIDLHVAAPVFLVIFLLGLGIPTGLLYVFKARTAKIPGHPLEAIRVPLTVSDGLLLHAGQPLDGRHLPAPQPVALLRQGTRSVMAAGVPLRTRMGAKPFGAGFVEATLPGYIGGSSMSAVPHGKNHAARLPLAVHNTWAVFGTAGDPTRAELLLLRGFDLDAAGFEDLLADARASVPAILASLASLAGVGSAHSGTQAGGPPTGASTGGFGLGGSPQAPPGGGFGLQPSPTSPPVAPAVAPPVAPAAGASPDSTAVRGPDAPPDWSSQSFGTFGLGTADPPDDPAGQRKAP